MVSRVKAKTPTLPVLDWLLAFGEEFDSRKIAKKTYVEYETIWHKKFKRI